MWQAGIIDRIAELTDHDDSIGGTAQMETLISLVNGACLCMSLRGSLTCPNFCGAHFRHAQQHSCSLVVMRADASSGSIGTTEEELIIATLMATQAPLLQIFSHSPALKRVDEWLSKAAATEANARIVQLLSLLAKMPMTITSLQVGRHGHEDARRVDMAPHLFSAFKLTSGTAVSCAGFGRR